MLASSRSILFLSSIQILNQEFKNSIITWIPPSTDTFLNFRLEALALSPTAHPNESIIETWNTSHTLQNLTPGGTYQVRLFTISEGKETPYAVKKFTTEPNQPSRFVVWNRKTTFMALLWQPPSPSGIYSGYKVSIEPPGKNYNISVQTISEAALYIASTGSYRTLPLPLKNVTVNKNLVTSTSFIVSWEAPNGRCEFDKYLISLDNIQTKVLNMRLREEDRNWIFKDLEPGKTNQVTVKTSSGTVSSEPTSLNVTLKPKQIVPGSLIVWNRNTTSMFLLWHTPSANDIYSGYKLTIEPSDALASTLFIDKGEALAPAHAAFNGLVPGQNYNISIQTISEDELSIPTIVNYRTLPLPPENVKIDKNLVTSTSFVVNWEAPSGRSEFDKYLISLNMQDEVITRLRDEDTQVTSTSVLYRYTIEV